MAQNYFKDDATHQQMRKDAGGMSVLPLPVCTWQRGEPQVNSELASACRTARVEYDAENNQWIGHPWPGHYRTQYTLTFWCRKNYTDDFIREWVLAQFGNPGAGNRETFIPVFHTNPWGQINQSLQLVDSVDLTQLEGQEPRYKRFQYTFSLRTWLMKSPVALAPQVQSAAISFAKTPSDKLPMTPVIVQPATNYQSFNLFTFGPIPDWRINELWPKSGSAMVGRGKIAPQGKQSGVPVPTLQMTFTSSNDSVDLGEWQAAPNAQGHSIYSLWFDYLLQGQPVTLDVSQRDPLDDARTGCLLVPLSQSAGWSKVHQFALVNKALVDPAIVGTGVGSGSGSGAAVNSTGWFSNVHFHQVYDQPPIFGAGSGSGSGSGPGNAVWTGLPNIPYLCVAVMSSASGETIIRSGQSRTVITTASSPGRKAWMPT